MATASRRKSFDKAIWLCLRFTLSLRDVEDWLAERGIIVSCETVRCWVNRVGPKIASELRKRRPKPHTVWHLDEVWVTIAGRMVYLWRAVCSEKVLDVLVQLRRNKPGALTLMRKLLKRSGFVPEPLTADKPPSYGAAVRELGIDRVHRTDRANDPAENSHQPTRRRERKMQRFKSPRIGAAISFFPRRRRQHIQPSTPPHLETDSPKAPVRRDDRVARGRRGGLTPYRSSAVVSFALDNVTMLH